MKNISKAWRKLRDTFRPLIPCGCWQRMRRMKIRILKCAFKPYVTRQRFGDVDLSLLISDPIAQDWYGRGGGLLTEIALMRTSQLIAGARIFNVGAHQGVVALQLAHEVGSTGLVVAVDANPHNVPIAVENSRLNEALNICVENAVIASRAGRLLFSNDWDGQVVGGGQCVVPAVTVDELMERYGRPHVLYIDVEGYECEVLAGATQALRHIPDLFIEVHTGLGLEEFGGSLKKLLGFLSVDDYELFAIRPARTRGDRDLFCAFDKYLDWIRERFYLVALKKTAFVLRSPHRDLCPES